MMEKPTEIADFQSKLKEFAVFAETVFQGTNQSYKKELLSKVGQFFCKQIDSCLSTWKSEFSNKAAKKENMDLPDEIWIRILGFMKKSDVFKRFALTCKRFNNLSLDPSLTKCLTLENLEVIDHEHVMKVLQRSRFLKKIEINQCKTSELLASTAFKNCNMLKSVKIRDYIRDENYQTNIAKILENSANKLENLSLYGFFTLTESAIKNLNNLKELCLEVHPALTSKDLITLAKNCKLETLHATISCNDQTDSAFKTFFEAMNGNMKNLKIGQRSYRPNISPSWTKYLSVCQSLEKIEIQDGPITILKDLSKLSNLKSLKLYSIGVFESQNLKAQETSHFFKKFDFDTIEDFCIWDMDISSENFTILTNRHFPNLNHICFSGCEKLKFDAGTLKKFISNAPKLLSIDMKCSIIDLTDEQLYQLMEKSRVKFGVGYPRRQQFMKYLKYQIPANAKKCSQNIGCQLCGFKMLGF